MVPVGSSASLSAKASAVATVLKVDEEEASRPAELGSTAPSSPSEEEATTTTTTQVITDSPTKKARRISKMTRFTELEPIKSNTTTVTVEVEPSPPSPEPQQKEQKKEKKEKRRPTANVTALPTSFDESALPPPKQLVLPTSPAPAPAKPGKLSKTAAAAANGKLVKKNRWSLRSSKSTAVAV